MILVVAKVIQNEYTVLIGQFLLLDEIASVNGCGALNRITLALESLWRCRFLCMIPTVQKKIAYVAGIVRMQILCGA